MGPERGALGVLDPDPQHVFDALEVDADGDVGRAAHHAVVLADLDPDGIEVDDRVELLQRPVLPLQDGVGHGVGDRRDRARRQLHADRRGQMMFDLADGHAARVEADDHVVQSVQTALALADQPRGERARPIPGNVDGERADLGLDRLRGGAVAGVRALGRCRLTFLVAQVAGQLRLQAPLQRGLEQRRQQPVGAGDLDLAGVDLGEQLVQRSAGLKLRDELVTRGR